MSDVEFSISFAGPLVTFQDIGRPGNMRYGVSAVRHNTRRLQPTLSSFFAAQRPLSLLSSHHTIHTARDRTRRETAREPAVEPRGDATRCEIRATTLWSNGRRADADGAARVDCESSQKGKLYASSQPPR